MSAWVVSPSVVSYIDSDEPNNAAMAMELIRAMVAKMMKADDKETTRYLQTIQSNIDLIRSPKVLNVDALDAYLSISEVLSKTPIDYNKLEEINKRIVNNSVHLTSGKLGVVLKWLLYGVTSIPSGVGGFSLIGSYQSLVNAYGNLFRSFLILATERPAALFVALADPAFDRTELFKSFLHVPGFSQALAYYAEKGFSGVEYAELIKQMVVGTFTGVDDATVEHTFSLLTTAPKIAAQRGIAFLQPETTAVVQEKAIGAGLNVAQKVVNSGYLDWFASTARKSAGWVAGNLPGGEQKAAQAIPEAIQKGATIVKQFVHQSEVKSVYHNFLSVVEQTVADTETYIFYIELFFVGIFAAFILLLLFRALEWTFDVRNQRKLKRLYQSMIKSTNEIRETAEAAQSEFENLAEWENSPRKQSRRIQEIMEMTSGFRRASHQKRSPQRSHYRRHHDQKRSPHRHYHDHYRQI